MSGSPPYIDGEDYRENNEAKRQGVPVARIAEYRHMEVSELCRLMGWPEWKEEPAADESFDLWRVSELDQVL